MDHPPGARPLGAPHIAASNRFQVPIALTLHGGGVFHEVQDHLDPLQGGDEHIKVRHIRMAEVKLRPGRGAQVQNAHGLSADRLDHLDPEAP
jgi:hypothetical protein